MIFKALLPSSQLSLTGFSDIDEFRPAEQLSNAKSIPLNVASFAPVRAVVCLPACHIVVQRSFARILDTAYSITGSLVIIPLDDRVRAQVNGAAFDARSFIALRGDVDCHFIEPSANLHATVIFSPEMTMRGWFNSTDKLSAFTADRSAMVNVRKTLIEILEIASSEPHLLQTLELATALQEKLLLALDSLFAQSHDIAVGGPARGRHVQIVRRIDDYIATHSTSAIYSADLATECGTSIRTMHTAVSQIRGLSLHQYLRLKGLWSVRSRLLKGGSGASVMACARVAGFAHMGDFAAHYRAHFNEAPSRTLARAHERSPGR